MTTLTFGPFAFIPERHLLLEEGTRVKIGKRALDVLALLTARRGHCVTNRELMAHVWPSIDAEDINLRVQMTALRKALRDGTDGRRYIRNVPGRGYEFVAEVQEEQGDSAALAQAGAATAPLNLPMLPSKLHGRQDSIDKVAGEIQSRRLVTVVGSGGIGKTSLALAVAAAKEAAFPDGVYFVDLATITDPDLVASTISAVAGIPVISTSPVSSLVERLRTSQLLFVLDNCEHVISGVAQVAEGLLKGCPQVRILATSREPLLMDGEWTCRLEPLECPGDARLPIGEALGFPAIALFVERASAADSKFMPTNEDVADLVEICRRLDGIPLAMELAAPRVELLGLTGLREQLGDLFTVLSRGRRTALPRQQTLRATLDWSFNLLSEREKSLLECISVFKASFSLDAALAVASTELSRSEIVDTVNDLVSRSLLVSVRGETEATYRLLEVTRAYALERVERRRDREALLRSYATYIRDLFVCAENDLAIKTPEAWLRHYGRFLEDVRAVLDWALSARNDVRLGVDLTTSSASLWIQNSLFAEYAVRVEMALESGSQTHVLERRDELRLNMALGHLVLHTKEELDEMSAAFNRAFEVARDGTVAERCQALASGFVAAISFANYPVALECAQRFGEIAPSSDDAAQMANCRMLAVSHHFLGQHDLARVPVARVLQQPVPLTRLAYQTGLQIDVKVSMEAILSRSAWLEGRPDEALERAASMVDWALSNSSAGSICYFLAIAAAPIALWSGDWMLARAIIQQLEATAAEGGLRFWGRWAKCLDYALLHETGGAAPRDCVNPQSWGEKQVDFLATVGVESVLERAMARIEQGMTGWCAPEVVRAWAECAMGAPGTDTSQDWHTLFHRSLALANEQGAHAWGLRAATSIARAAPDAAKTPAEELLSRALDKIHGGRTTKDVLAAVSLLESISRRV